jgi:glycosyltransferase involved in cell wall biosynthesis
VLTVSEFSAREIADAYGIPPDRITVAPLGVSPRFAHADAGMPADLPADVTPPYLLHVGDLHARRNLDVVVDALIAARRHLGELPAQLVVAGVDRGPAAGLAAALAEAGLPEALVPLGAVSEERLHALYRHASALVYPSRYEGFGLPLVEAMASGTPVLASGAASIPEVVGDAAILLDPDDTSGWMDAIIRIVNDEALRARMAAAGTARAAAFTWARTARTTMSVYRRVGGRAAT